MVACIQVLSKHEKIPCISRVEFSKAFLRLFVVKITRKAWALNER